MRKRKCIFFIKMEVVEEVLECIKEIHQKKKKADLHTIINKMKDFAPNDIKEILKSLCDKNILVTTQRNGTDSYIFTKNDKIEKETETDDNDEDNKDEDEYIEVVNASTQSENLLEEEIAAGVKKCFT